MQFYVQSSSDCDHSYIVIMNIFTIQNKVVHWISYKHLNLTLMKLSCRKVSMITTSSSMHGLFMYLPFLAKTCASGMQLTMNSDGKILCTSQMFTFFNLPVGSEASSCLVPINLMILKLGMYFASQIDYLSKFLIIIKSPILYYGMSLYLSVFCLECASFILRAANM